MLPRIHNVASAKVTPSKIKVVAGKQIKYKAIQLHPIVAICYEA